jgi:validoxylamine A glucosyltransferase
MEPIVSVIIPTFNDDLRLEWALEGLCCQTVRNFEVIVVNDAGPRSTKVLVDSFKDRLNISYYYFGKKKKETRAGATRNFGVRYSIGELLLFLDTDMVPDPDLIEAHSAYYLPDVSYFGYRRQYPMELVRPFSPPLDYEELYRHSLPDRRFSEYPKWKTSRWHVHFLSCNYSIPAKVFCELGGHDDRFEGWGGEDIDLGYRILLSGYQIYPLWGMGMGTHLNHPKRPLSTVAQTWYCNPNEPLCRNGGPLIRLVEENTNEGGQ